MNKRKKWIPILVLIIVFILMFCVGCVPSWIPSDNEAAKLVKDYYLFYNSGESVQAAIAKRGEFIKECECYPIAFNIVLSSGKNRNKTFYFYKNDAGNLEANEYIGRISMVPIKYSRG